MQQQPVALVTGSGGGIGAAACRALEVAGYQVYGTTRRTPEDGADRRLAMDVTDDASVAAAVATVLDRSGRLDVLVNNAGVGASGAAEESSSGQTRQIFEVNVFGLIRMTRAVLPRMRAQGSGRIINVSSVYGFVPAPYMALYAASKHAVEGYSESLDHELREHGIRVLLVEPAFTRTAFDANLLRADSPVPAYENRRRTADRLIQEAVRNGDEPAVAAKAIVAAATDRKPKLRYPAGTRASRVSMLRRVVPAGAFDRQIQKLNHLS